MNADQSHNPIDAGTAAKLFHFVDLIAEWNPRINLTGFHSKDEIREFLIEESHEAAAALKLSDEAVLDVGSGAGIPGLVWAILRPRCKITSVESRQKKIAFQKEVLRETGASAELVCGHFPEAVLGRKFDLITTRAVRFSPTNWKAARALLNPGGHFVYFATSSGSPGPTWKAIPVSKRSSLWIATDVS